MTYIYIFRTRWLAVRYTAGRAGIVMYILMTYLRYKAVLLEDYHWTQTRDFWGYDRNGLIGERERVCVCDLEEEKECGFKNR